YRTDRLPDAGDGRLSGRRGDPAKRKKPARPDHRDDLWLRGWTITSRSQFVSMYSRRLSSVGRRSYLQKQLVPVHPVQNKPINRQYHGSQQEWLVRCPQELEEVRTQVNAERIGDEAIPQMRDEVRRDRVHSNHYQRERKLAVPAHIHEPTESG